MISNNEESFVFLPVSLVHAMTTLREMWMTTSACTQTSGCKIPREAHSILSSLHRNPGDGSASCMVKGFRQTNSDCLARLLLAGGCPKLTNATISGEMTFRFPVSYTAFSKSIEVPYHSTWVASPQLCVNNLPFFFLRLLLFRARYLTCNFVTM